MLCQSIGLTVLTLQARDRRQDHRPRTIGALRKDVTAKCYGGDATRMHEHGQRGALFERSAEAAGEAKGGEEADA